MPYYVKIDPDTRVVLGWAATDSAPTSKCPFDDGFFQVTADTFKQVSTLPKDKLALILPNGIVVIDDRYDLEETIAKRIAAQVNITNQQVTTTCHPTLVLCDVGRVLEAVLVLSGLVVDSDIDKPTAQSTLDTLLPTLKWLREVRAVHDKIISDIESCKSKEDIGKVSVDMRSGVSTSPVDRGK